MQTCQEMVEDLYLIFSNAKQFNISSSQIHKDASTLQKFVETKLPEYAAKEVVLKLPNLLKQYSDLDAFINAKKLDVNLKFRSISE